MAGVIEAIDVLRRQAAVIAGVKPGALGPPLRVQHPDRPTAEPPKRKAATPAEIAQFFSRHMKGG